MRLSLCQKRRPWLQQVVHLSGPAKLYPPRCIGVPIPQMQRLSTRPDGEGFPQVLESEASRRGRGRLASPVGAPPGKVVAACDRRPLLLPEAWITLRPRAGTAAQRFGPRVPSDEDPVVQPAAPRGQWFAPPPRVPLRRGLTATVSGLGDSGLSPALPELQARRHLVAAPGFRSGKCESG